MPAGRQSRGVPVGVHFTQGIPTSLHELWCDLQLSCDDVDGVAVLPGTELLLPPAVTHPNSLDVLIALQQGGGTPGRVKSLSA